MTIDIIFNKCVIYKLTWSDSIIWVSNDKGQRYIYDYKIISRVLRMLSWLLLTKLRKLKSLLLSRPWTFDNANTRWKKKRKAAAIAASVTFPIKATRACFHRIQFDRIISDKWGKYVFVIIVRSHFFHFPPFAVSPLSLSGSRPHPRIPSFA